jgi:hypothetical protein
VLVIFVGRALHRETKLWKASESLTGGSSGVFGSVVDFAVAAADYPSWKDMMEIDEESLGSAIRMSIDISIYIK